MPAMTTVQSRSRPELAVDLLDQEGDVVAGTPGAERAEQRQVLAHLGRVDLGGRAQQLGGDGRRARPQQLLEDPLVDGEAGHRGLGDASARGAGDRRAVARCWVAEVARHGQDRRAERGRAFVVRVARSAPELAGPLDGGGHRLDERRAHRLELERAHGGGRGAARRGHRGPELGRLLARLVEHPGRAEQGPDHQLPGSRPGAARR